MNKLDNAPFPGGAFVGGGLGTLGWWGEEA